MPEILSLVALSETDAHAIREVDVGVRLIEAGGWFDGEFADTWPAATVARYVSGAGRGSRAQRDRLLASAEIVICGFPYPLDLHARSPRLSWVHQTPAGASNLKGSDLWGKDLTVTTSRGYGDSAAIAEYAIAGLLHFAKSFDHAHTDRARARFEHAAYAPRALHDHTLCVIGCGGIGREIGRLARALGMRVVGTRATPASASDAVFERIGAPCDLHALLAESDYVALACQWTPATTGLLDAAAFAAMKPGAIVVNVARGEIIDEAALLAALTGGRVRGAVLDVYVGEFEGPPPAALWNHPRVLITPHTSAWTDSNRRRALELFRANLRRYLAGEALENRIDWARGY